MSSEGDDDITNLSFGLQGLTVSVHRTAGHYGNVLNISITEAPRLDTARASPRAKPSEPPGNRPSGSTTPLDRPPPAASSEAAPSELPEDVARLADRLGGLGGLTGLARIERAFALGLADRQAFDCAREGSFCYQAASGRLVGGRTAACVILACSSRQEPAWTRSYTSYLSLVGQRGGGLQPQSVSRSFCSIREAEAYCRGAGLECLPTELA